MVMLHFAMFSVRQTSIQSFNLVEIKISDEIMPVATFSLQAINEKTFLFYVFKIITCIVHSNSNSGHAVRSPSEAV